MAGAKKFDFKTMKFADIPAFLVALVKGEAGGPEEMMTGQTGKYEINLVPDVKLKMIHMQKIRNLILFICLVVIAVSGTVVAVLGSVKGAQDLTMQGQDTHLKNLSDTIMQYDELPTFLTLQNQLAKISEIEKRQPLLSRIFPIMSTMIPSCGSQDKDNVCMSEMSVNLQNSTVTFDALADARVQPLIDYRVLESFKKTVGLMTYDYGRYVDAEGNEIPSRCIEETDANGNMYTNAGSIYAIWKRGQKGCDPQRDDYSTDEDGSVNPTTYNEDIEEEDEEKEDTDKKKKEEEEEIVSNLNAYTDSSLQNTTFLGDNNTFGVVSTKIKKKSDGTTTTTVIVVPDEIIYRTPQFTNWYKGKVVKTAEDGVGDVLPESTDDVKFKTTTYTYHPEMDTGGSIYGVPHFESQCITYSGISDGDDVKWTADNSCMLVPDGIKINGSSNGRDADGNLVLRFNANVTFDANIFAYNNKHVMAISPSKQNVTDSYKQTESMFSAPATDCDPDDSECMVPTTEVE